MILLTSAAYLDQEFSSEFGRIPPAFLPVGNQRLYHHQVATLPDDERRVLTVPESYQVGNDDALALADLGVELLEIPDGLSLGESVICAINLSSLAPSDPLRILHGDTLIADLPIAELDAIGLSEVDGNYNWAVFTGDEERLLTPLDDTRLARGPVHIANGYFSFSDSGLLVRAITKKRGNFIDGISLYAQQKPLKTVTTEQWLDFGHIHTFYRSKSQMTTQRAFNEMTIGTKTVVKRSDKIEKMHAEARWFQTLPDDLKVHTPHFIREIEGPDRHGYEIEYLYLTALNELFVFGSLPRFVWRRIFSTCFNFLDQCRRHPQDQEIAGASSLFQDKTQRRLDEFSAQSGADLDASWTINGRATPGLTRVADFASGVIESATREPACVSHGDFCFSNILFDFRTQGIKVIDPRGLDAGDQPNIFGSQLYDLAKLAHSAIGQYDFVIAGYYQVERDGQNLTLSLGGNDAIGEIQGLFQEMVEQRFKLTLDQLLAMQVHLFLSMLPLHADDEQRQTALLANALRLYAQIDGAP